jgi:hypothetical protein
MKLAPHKVARLGLGYCGRHLTFFASLSAEET